MVIGRDTSCDVRVDAPSVSSRHASVRWSSDQLEARDLGSTYGTFVDDARISDWVHIPLGATVWIGDAALSFRPIWPATPTPVRFRSPGASLAFTVTDPDDQLDARELTDFPELLPYLPLRFARTRGEISAVLDGSGASHPFQSGQLELGGVTISVNDAADPLASMMAPTPSSFAASQPEASKVASDEPPTSAGDTEVPQLSAPPGAPAARAEEVPSPPDNGGVSKGTGQGGTGIDWLMLLMGIAALIALGAFAVWILQ